MSKNSAFRLLQAASVLLFLFQALRVIFSVLFGIIYDGIFEGPFTPWLVISNVLIIAAFMLPSIVGRGMASEQLSLWALIAGIARIALSVNIAIVRYWGSLFVILAGLIFFVGLLRRQRKFVFASVVLALSLDQLFKVLGSTLDISLQTWWLPIQILWAMFLVWIGLGLRGNEPESSEGSVGLGIGSGLAIGGFLFLQESLLALPNGLARWSGVSYAVIAPFLLAITVLFLVSKLHVTFTRLIQPTAIRIALFALLLGGLMLGYFIEGVVSAFGLLIAQMASLTILLFVNKTEGHRTGLALSLGMLFFLILNFLNAFAFTYPYILPAMKGMGWVVYLVAGISVVFLLPGRKSTPVDGALVFDGLGVVPLVVAVLLALISVWPVKAEDLSNGRTLRFATYNIHYGYDDAWRYTLEEIAEAIEEIGCDFVALQEVDTGRLTSYGVDNALYLARRLKMNVAYLPTIEHLTGIAVLYRGSTAVENSSLISSLEEQTGIVQVSIEGKRGELHAFGIWIGLSKEDTETQIAEAIEFIGDQSPALFGGDFNADPESDVAAAIRLAGFSDPFETLAIDPAPNTSPAIDPDNRIDFVWLRGFEPVEAWVPDSLASDHRIVVVEVELPE